MNSNTIVIFGAFGQDGHYLSMYCALRGWNVIGLGRSGERYELRSVVGGGLARANGTWVANAVANSGAVETLIKDYQPAFIFHLAANSTTNHSAARENHETIGMGALNILEAVRCHSAQSRVFLAGSCLQFVNDGSPISEDNPLAAESGYAAVRNYTLFLARYYRAIVELKVYFGFFFHHESPYRKDRHISSMIAGAARKAAVGDAVMLEMEDLQACREWTFAGDTVEAIWKLVSQDRIFEACIGTGRPRTVAEFAHACFDAVGLNWTDHVTEAPIRQGARAKPICANPGVIYSLGWKQTIGLDELARMMVAERPTDGSSKPQAPSSREAPSSKAVLATD